MFITSGRIKSLNPADGSVIWENRVPGAIAMPVLLPDMRLFISNPDQGGCTMLQLDKAGKAPADTLWQNKFMRNHFNSSLYHNGAIYGFSNATLRCIDAETGKRLWNKRGLGKGSLVEADGKLFVLSDTFRRWQLLIYVSRLCRKCIFRPSASRGERLRKFY